MLKTVMVRCSQGLLGFMILISLVLGGNGPVAQAQSSSDNWDSPINLSRSGGTMDPIAAVDPSGGIHVIWQDNTRGYFMYSQTTDKGWSAPEQIATPFDTQPVDGSTPVRSPVTLVALSHSRLVALWLVHGELRYSVAYYDKSKLLDNWAAPIVISTAAANFAVSVDSKNALHMVFIQAASVPGFEPGIYYTRLAENISSWLTPNLLYGSPYYRSGPTTDLKNSLDITTSDVNGTTMVYAAFDNQNRKRIFFSDSVDGGNHWSDAEEMDGPKAEGGQTSPYNVRVQANANGVMVVWQISQSSNVCFQNYRYSTDGAKTWSESQRMPMTILSCADQIRFMKGLAAGPVLMTVVQNQVFLTAWDGKQWSDAENQAILSGFQDPDTLVNVSFGCRQTLSGGTGLVVSVGCDQGQGGDIWLTTRKITDLSGWFSGKASWRDPTIVHSVNGPAANVKLVADPNGQLHAIWSQFEEVQTTNADATVTQQGERVLYYAQWNDGHWSSPTIALRSPKQANGTANAADDPAVVIDANDHILVAWKATLTNELYFSWANAAKAVNSMEWTKPTVIANVGPITSTPELWADPNGVITLAYSVPINEKRGIYLTQSKDMGATWSDPVRAFDGTGAGWQMVGKPSFIHPSDQNMDLLWTQDGLNAGTGPGGLYYSHSSDNGSTWTKPETVSTNVVLWNQIVLAGNGAILRVWKEVSSGQTVLLYQTSQDGGKTWSKVDRLSNAADLPGSVSLTSDRAGQIHFTDIIEDAQKRLVLRYLFWDDKTWSPVESQDIGFVSPNFDIAISSAVTSTDLLGVIGFRPAVGNSGNQVTTELFFTDRLVKIAPGKIPAATSVKAVATVVTTPTPTTYIPQPTATIDLASLSKGGPIQSSGSTTGLVASGVVALLVVAVGFIFKMVTGRTANRN